MREGDDGLKKARTDIVNYRQALKRERSQEVMADIDRHRHSKIMLFKRGIEDCKK